MSHTARTDRKYSFDNLRFFLICCVVLGHLLEISPPFRGSYLLYRTVYSFHIPAFLFLTGYFASFRPRQILSGYLLPYVLFQTLYILFYNTLFGSGQPLQYTTPSWILWYLLVCVYCHLLLPFFDTDSPGQQVLALLSVFTLALAAGFDDSLSYFGSFSRFFVFQPWFVLGFFFRKWEQSGKCLSRKGRILRYGVCLGIIFCSLVFLKQVQMEDSVLYGSVSYAESGATVFHRLAVMVTSLGWIGLLVSLFEDFFSRRLPLITAAGQNTLPVFLLHGFAVTLTSAYCTFVWKLPLAVFPLTLFLVLFFGNSFWGRIFRFLFRPRR